MYSTNGIRIEVVSNANLQLVFFPWSSRLYNWQPIMHRKMVGCLMKHNGTKSQLWPFQFTNHIMPV